ncbi:hypothetical protein BJY04DRAFT_94478 [Aspergillus karnatakaensis]|uniref:uncharacterized protein n=1 Tax=Aspergillus karnatakaensis TaxID=1810916 RepID=UPI003CCE3580
MPISTQYSAYLTKRLLTEIRFPSASTRSNHRGQSLPYSAAPNCNSPSISLPANPSTSPNPTCFILSHTRIHMQRNTATPLSLAEEQQYIPVRSDPIRIFTTPNPNPSLILKP